MRQTMLRIIMMLFMVGFLATNRYCSAQLTGHSYAIATFSSAFLFKQLWSSFNSTHDKVTRVEMRDPGNVMATLDSVPSWAWEALFVVCLYRSVFKKSNYQRSDFSSYLKPLLPSIGGLLAGAFVVAVLDKFF
jgi:hypothetical protein